jgi:hypothetical protein
MFLCKILYKQKVPRKHLVNQRNSNITPRKIENSTENIHYKKEIKKVFNSGKI